MSTLFVIIKSLSLSLAYILSPVFQPCFLIFYPPSQPTCATVTDLSTTSCSFQTRSLHSPRSNSSEVSLPGHHLLLPSKSCPLVQGSLTLSVFHFVSKLCISHFVWVLITLFLLIKFDPSSSEFLPKLWPSWVQTLFWLLLGPHLICQ